jgi:hypothetical protein
MKNSMLSITAFALLLFTSCNDTSNDITNDCSECFDEHAWTPYKDSVFLKNHLIDSSDAEAQLLAYKEFIDTVILDLKAHNPDKYANVEEQLIYGVKVDYKELAELIRARDTTCGLFAMTGMHNDTSHMLFSVRHNVREPYMEYFNFTHPCPSACPPISLYNQLTVQEKVYNRTH